MDILRYAAFLMITNTAYPLMGDSKIRNSIKINDKHSAVPLPSDAKFKVPPGSFAI